MRTPHRSLVGVAILLASAALTACGADTGPDASSSNDAGATVDTAFGEITVPEGPVRIVADGMDFVELLGYLDVEPIAFSYGLSDEEEMLAEAPWLEGTYTGQPDPDLLTGDFQLSPEAVAALDPDLILTHSWAVDQPLYDKLSQIAPTYTGFDDHLWSDYLADLAVLTGHDTSVVDQAQADLDAEYAAAAQDLPGLQGATFQVAVGDDDQLFGLYEYANASMQGLGLELGEGQPTEGSVSGDVQRFSLETIGTLDADVVLVAIPGFYDANGELRSALQDDPRVARLPAAQNGTLVYLSEQEWGAVNGGTPQSVRWWLDEIEPVLAASALNRSADR